MGKIFEYGLDAPQPGTLLLSAVAAFLYLFMVAGKPSARRTGVKTLSVALLAVLCVLVDGPLVPVAIYIVVIVAMALSALAVPGWGVAVGAALFMASDTVLAAQKFLLAPERSPYLRASFVWISYYLAQLLMTLSVLALV